MFFQGVGGAPETPRLAHGVDGAHCRRVQLAGSSQSCFTDKAWQTPSTERPLVAREPVRGQCVQCKDRGSTMTRLC